MTRARMTAFAAVAVLAVGAWADQPATTVRVFQLRHASVAEAAEAVQPLLTERGSLTLQQNPSRITVQDDAAVVERVAKLIQELDRVPGEYQVWVELLEGTNEALDPSQRVEVAEGARRMFPFAAYRRIAAATFKGEVGTRTSASLGEEFQLSFSTAVLAAADDAPWGMPQVGSRVHIEDLTLQRVAKNADGSQRLVDIVRTALYLGPGQEAVFGAGASESSARGLVLIVRTDSPGEP